LLIRLLFFILELLLLLEIQVRRLKPVKPDLYKNTLTIHEIAALNNFWDNLYIFSPTLPGDDDDDDD